MSFNTTTFGFKNDIVYVISGFFSIIVCLIFILVFSFFLFFALLEISVLRLFLQFIVWMATPLFKLLCFFVNVNGKFRKYIQALSNLFMVFPFFLMVYQDANMFPKSCTFYFGIFWNPLDVIFWFIDFLFLAFVQLVSFAKTFPTILSSLNIPVVLEIYCLNYFS